MIRIAILLLCLSSGCLRSGVVPTPRPDVPGATEMDRYVETFRMKLGKALGDTAAEVDGLDEVGYRKLLGAKLKKAAEDAHAELSAADKTLSDGGYTPAKAKAILLRRQSEVTRGQ